MTARALVEARARLKAVFPAAHDASDDPNPLAPSRLPAFTAALSLGGGDLIGMGGGEYLETGDLRISIWDAGHAPGSPVRTDLVGLAQKARAAILGAPADLSGAVWSIAPASEERDIAAGQSRQGRVDLAFEVQVLTG